MADTAPQTAAQRRTASFEFLDRPIELLEPTSGQALILLSMAEFADESAARDDLVRAARNFGIVLGSLFVSQVDRQFVDGSLARGNADLPEYVKLATDMASHWELEGPEADNRPARRAAARRKAPR